MPGVLCRGVPGSDAAASNHEPPTHRAPGTHEAPGTITDVIQLSDLTKSFGDRVLLDHVTWQIGDGDRVGLCGPNGAGKTTLLRMLARLDEPDEGNIATPANLTI